MMLLSYKSQFISPAIENCVMVRRETWHSPSRPAVRLTFKSSQVFSYKSISQIFCLFVWEFFDIVPEPNINNDTTYTLFPIIYANKFEGILSRIWRSRRCEDPLLIAGRAEMTGKPPPARPVFASPRKAVLRIRIRMFLGLLDPDPLVRGSDPDPSIIKQK